MTLEEEVGQLRAENQRLREQNALLSQQVTVLREENTLLGQRVAELEQGDKHPPAFVKPNKPKPAGPKGPRRKRAAEHNRGRKREGQVTRRREHALEHCPGFRAHSGLERQQQPGRAGAAPRGGDAQDQRRPAPDRIGGRGSKMRMALASLFGTWQARGLNPFTECVNLLRQTPLPQV